MRAIFAQTGHSLATTAAISDLAKAGSAALTRAVLLRLAPSVDPGHMEVLPFFDFTRAVTEDSHSLRPRPRRAVLCAGRDGIPLGLALAVDRRVSREPSGAPATSGLLLV